MRQTRPITITLINPSIRFSYCKLDCMNSDIAMRFGHTLFNEIVENTTRVEGRVDLVQKQVQSVIDSYCMSCNTNLNMDCYLIPDQVCFALTEQKMSNIDGLVEWKPMKILRMDHRITSEPGIEHILATTASACIDVNLEKKHFPYELIRFRIIHCFVEMVLLQRSKPLFIFNPRELSL